MDKVFREKNLHTITHKDFNEFIKGKGFKGRNNYKLRDLKAMFGFKPMITGSPVMISSDGMEPIKDKAYEFNSGIGKCPCGQTFECKSERDMKMKLRMHLRFCSNPPKGFNKIGIPKKATTLREQQLAEAERMHKVHN